MKKGTHQGRVLGCCLLLILLLFLSPPAHGKGTTRLGVGAGAYNIFDRYTEIYSLIDIRPPLRAYGIGTWITLAGNRGAFYLSGGILKDFSLSRSLILTPSFGIGFYEQESGMALGHSLEFRSAIKLSHEFPNASRIGVRFGHISNAGIGNINPGSEFISLIYSIPLGAE
jgi:hypothetical protein